MISKKIFNWLLVCLLATVALMGTLQAAQGSGGPDDGGYIYEDSHDPGGPAYSWDDISTTGTALSLANDAMSAAIPITFPFSFYGTEYSNIYVSSNGFLTFLASQPNANTPAAIPTAATPNAIIAGYWANLNPRFLLGGASIRYQVLGDAPNRRIVVAFIGVPHNGDSFLSPARSTFEFKLFEGTNIIEIHYNSMASNGDRHVAGIENASGTAGLSYFDDPADTIANSTAVRFSRFTGVAERPTYAIQYGPPGTTLTFNQRVANWTGAASTFSLTKSGDTWATRLVMGPKDFTTVALAQGESATFTVEVDIPSNAVPSSSSQVSVKVEGGGYSNTSTLVAAVPRRGYGLGYYNVDSDNAFSAIMPLDTTFHNSLYEAIDGTDLGPFLYLGAAIRPDVPELWIVSSSATSDTGETLPARVYAIGIDPLGNLSTGSIQNIDISIDATDVAFTPNGRTAVVSGYGAGTAAFIDTATHTVTGPTISTGANSSQIATGACVPNKAYVTNNGTSGTGANSVSVINIAGQSLIKNITGFNQPIGVVISPTAYRAFVTNKGNGSIGVINTQTDTLAATWSNIGSSLAGIDITPDGSKLYVAAGTDVKVVDASSGTVITTIPTGVDNLYDIKVFPQDMGNFAYVTSQNANVETVQVIDTSSNTIVKQIADDWNVMGLALFPITTQCAMGPVAPVASFTPRNAVAKVNVPVPWTNTSDYSPTSYQWNFGDGSTSTDANPTHTYTAVGSYTVTLTATNAQGSDTFTGTVNFAPTAAFTPTASVIRPGESIAFTNQSTGTNTTANPLTFVWDFGDGTATSTETSPTHQFDAGADTTVTLTAHNGFGADSVATGTVKFRPRAQFSPTKAGVSAGESVTFTDQSTGPGPLTYLWEFGDNTTSTLQSPSHTYSTSGVYTVKLTVNNANGSDSTSGTVGFKPAAGFSQSASSVSVNQAVTFTNTTTGPEPITFSWNFGDGSAASTEKSPQHQYATAGTYTITLTATNDYGSTQQTGTVQVVTTDTTPPTVTINQASGQADPTSASPIQFTVVFSESVTGFTGSDVALSGTAGATTAAVSGGPATYTVSVSGMTASGTVIASIPAGAAVDAGGNGNTASTTTDNSVTFNLNLVPDLKVTKSHTGSFTQGQTGATYTISVSNVGSGPTSGTVTVVDTLPTGLTATAIGGTGWSCTLSTLTCTRSDALAPGASYTAITLTVNVASSAPASVINNVSISGGGDANTANNSASDSTIITAASTTTAKIVSTSTTCSQFSNGTASQVSEVVYTVSSGRIRTLTPNGFIYYTKVVASGTTFTVGVQQSNTQTWPALSASQVTVYTASCGSKSATVRTGTAPTAQVSGATAGATYYVAFRYALTSLSYRTVTSPYPTVTYSYVTKVGGTQVSTSAASVKIRPQ